MALLYFCCYQSDSAASQDLDSRILMGPFQLRIFYVSDCMILGGVWEWFSSPPWSPMAFGRGTRYTWPEIWCYFSSSKVNHMQYLCSIKPENPYQSQFLTFSSAMLQIYKLFLSDFIPRNASWLSCLCMHHAAFDLILNNYFCPAIQSPLIGGTDLWCKAWNNQVLLERFAVTRLKHYLLGLHW